MKKILLVTAVFIMSFSVATSSAYALSFFFDFEDGISQSSQTPGLSGLRGYMEGVFGSEVRKGDARWVGSSNIFGSDAIFTHGASSRLDFDRPTSGLLPDYEITSLSFDWGVVDATPGRDFGLDVYDDARFGGSGGWRNNIFTVRGAGNGAHGSSGLITFRPQWEVTRIRFHDSGTFDVGLDNLTINDNRRQLPSDAQAPEPATIALLGTGLIGLAGRIRRQRKNS